MEQTSKDDAQTLGVMLRLHISQMWRHEYAIKWTKDTRIKSWHRGPQFF